MAPAMALGWDITLNLSNCEVTGNFIVDVNPWYAAHVIDAPVPDYVVLEHEVDGSAVTTFEDAERNILFGAHRPWLLECDTYDTFRSDSHDHIQACLEEVRCVLATAYSATIITAKLLESTETLSFLDIILQSTMPRNHREIIADTYGNHNVDLEFYFSAFVDEEYEEVDIKSINYCEDDEFDAVSSDLPFEFGIKEASAEVLAGATTLARVRYENAVRHAKHIEAALENEIRFWEVREGVDVTAELLGGKQEECPICLEIRDCVVSPCRHTVCRDCSSNKCVVCGHGDVPFWCKTVSKAPVVDFIKTLEGESIILTSLSNAEDNIGGHMVLNTIHFIPPEVKNVIMFAPTQTVPSKLIGNSDYVGPIAPKHLAWYQAVPGVKYHILYRKESPEKRAWDVIKLL